MAQFLCDAYEGTVAEILQLERNKNFDTNKAISLNTQLGVVGMIKDLPVILSELKRQFDERAKLISINKERVKDPLAEGE
jgi:hypothetical protein